MNIYCGWIYAIDKYGYPPSLENTYRSIKEMAKLGFTNIELEGVNIEKISEQNLMEIFHNRKRIKELCNDLGLRVVNFMSIVPDIISLNKNKREKALQSFYRGIELAHYFGCAYVTSDSYTPPLVFIDGIPYRQTENFGKDFGKQYRIKINPHFRWCELWDAVIETFSRCNAAAKKADLRFTIEPRVGEIVSNTDAMLRLLDTINDENLGVALDTAHLNPQKEILPLSVEKLGKRIFYVHASDNDGRDNRHLGLGKGTVDWQGIFTALKKHGFKGHVGVDIGAVPNLDIEFQNARRFLLDLGKKLSL